MAANLNRRKFCKSAGMVFMIVPVLTVCQQAQARTNAKLREKLNYQNTPKDTMSCTTCLEFAADQSDQKRGTCKVIPDDDEISPDGYCQAWNTM